MAEAGSGEQSDLSEEQAEGRREIRIPPFDFSWMYVTSQWGIRAQPSKHGLTLGGINVGIYGEIPDRYANKNLVARGAIESPGVLDQGFTVGEKQEVWAESTPDLYEEAIQRRWIPATDVPWDTLVLLPADVERAWCQIATEISERSLVALDAVATWVARINYGYHEVKCFLATVMFDLMRHNEAFRKRALANGGGLGLQTPQWGHRNVVSAKNYTELTMMLFILQDAYLLTLCHYAESLAPSEAEVVLFRRTKQDLARHLAYGAEHLRYTLGKAVHRREELQNYLRNGEIFWIRDMILNTPLPAAIAILAGGSPEKAEEGMQTFEAFRRDFILRYLGYVEWAGILGWEDEVTGLMARWAGIEQERPDAGQAAVPSSGAV